MIRTLYEKTGSRYMILTLNEKTGARSVKGCLLTARAPAIVPALANGEPRTMANHGRWRIAVDIGPVIRD